jgi:phosphatidylserine synthase
MSESVRPRRMFGLKDVFTTLNCLSGAIAIILCVEGRPFAAGVSILLGWAADALDGQVARWTNTQNRFGGEYDTISDHLAHVIAPAAIVFTVYKDQGAALGVPPQVAWWLAVALGGMIMVAGSVRHARNLVRPVSYKGIWCGLPRTMIGFLAIGYANSVFLWQLPGGGWIGVAIAILSCVFTLTYIPFASHHLVRSFTTFTRVAVASCVLSLIGFLVWKPVYVFDVLLFWSVGYSLAATRVGLTADERAQWAELVAAAKARTDI